MLDALFALVSALLGGDFMTLFILAPLVLCPVVVSLLTRSLLWPYDYKLGKARFVADKAQMVNIVLLAGLLGFCCWSLLGVVATYGW